MTEPFHGAKVAILVGDRVVSILRDDVPTIPWPGFWDLPGGGREGQETPKACVLRELKEELGISLDPAQLSWSVNAPSEPSTVWFFVAECPDFKKSWVTFGNEGQRWDLVHLKWFLESKKVIYHHQNRLRQYLDVRAVQKN